MKIDRVLVYEPFIREAILGARLSYGSGGKSDSSLVGDTLIIGDDDRKLCRKLLVGAIGEDKFLRSIPVSAHITAPLKFWVELDTYKVGTVRQSSSLMHRVASRAEFTKEDFEIEDEQWTEPRMQVMLANLNGAVQDWLNTTSGRRTDKWPEWTLWQDLVPRSFRYISHWYANYAVLSNIYYVRKNHRMSSQWRPFCQWIESLPHSWLITREPLDAP